VPKTDPHEKTEKKNTHADGGGTSPPNKHATPTPTPTPTPAPQPGRMVAKPKPQKP
jgi:hypothetical protein